MTLNLAADQAYSVADVCGMQIGQVSENGTPLTVAGGGLTMLIPGVVEFTETDVVEAGRTDVDFNGGGGYCSRRVIDDRITGQELALNLCGKQLAVMEFIIGNRGRVFDDNDNVVGHRALSVSDACRCDDPGAIGGFYILLWSNVFDCEGDPLFDDSNDRMYEITAYPWVKRLTPTNGRRRTVNLQDARRAYRGQLRSNPNFGQGPGSAVLIPDQTMATPPQPLAGITDPMVFLSDVNFPGNCDCLGQNEGGSWVAGDPIPVGEAGWVDPGGS